MDRSSEVKAQIDAVVANIRAARLVEKPFHHLEFDRVFPDDVYARMMAAMPNAADYRPLPGRNRGNIREDGSSTRVKIDLFPEYIRHLTDDKRAIWDLVGRALCSSEVQAAFTSGLAPGLERRFGNDFANVGMYPIPVLTRDIPGYRITPHTDTQWKGITVQLYLPRDASATHIGTIFHERLPARPTVRRGQQQYVLLAAGHGRSCRCASPRRRAADRTAPSSPSIGCRYAG